MSLKVPLKSPHPSLGHLCLKFQPLQLLSCLWSASLAQLQAQSRGCCTPSLPLVLRSLLVSAAEVLPASHCPAFVYKELYNALSLLCRPGHRKLDLQCKEQARVTLQMLWRGTSDTPLPSLCHSKGRAIERSLSGHY